MTEPKFEVHDFVRKSKGYHFSGFVVGVAEKLDGSMRYVVENDDGLLHIFRASQLAKVKIGGDAIMEGIRADILKRREMRDALRRGTGPLPTDPAGEGRDAAERTD